MSDEDFPEDEPVEFDLPVRSFRERTKPLTTTPPEELARIFGKRDTLEDKRIALEAQARPQRIVTPGHEVPAEQVIKRTKAGGWSTASAFGKMAAVLEDLQVPFKLGRSEHFTGDVVKAVKGKVDGKQTAQTLDYQLVEGQTKEHVWLNFPWEGSLAALRGTEVSWRYQLFPYKEFIDKMIGGGDEDDLSGR